MIPRHQSHIRNVALLILLTLSAIGCRQPEYEVAEVDGTLTLQGQPGHKVHIEFVPDTGFKGPSASADTDAQGHFTLHLMLRDGSAPPGAVVGHHRVTLSDLQLSESATGRGVPMRFGPQYALVGTTPVKHEVKPGRQTIQLKAP